MARVHEVLRWANRREVAREVTRRGYRLSGEALNKWVRDEKEFPAVVERIVFELFTISGHKEAPAPEWAQGLDQKVDQIIQALPTPERLDSVALLISRLEALVEPLGGASGDPDGEQDQDGVMLRPPGDE
jgi:hypothetical protein